MQTWQPIDVEANGISIHVTRTGGAKPAVMLAHGITDDGLCWTPVAEALCERYDILMVDARGHGSSSAPGEGYDPVTQARDHYGVIHSLGLVKPVVLGHSMGAMTTMMLAGLYPDAPRAILLEDPPPWWLAKPVENAAPNEFITRLKDSTRQLQAMSREQIIEYAREMNPSWPEGELGPWADSKLRFNPIVAEAIEANRQNAAIDFEGTLRRITCPVLLITADNALGAILSPEDVAAFKAHVPHAEVAHIPGAGHSIRREQFAAYMETVANFLERVTGV